MWLEVLVREHVVVWAAAGRRTLAYDPLGQKNGWCGRTATEQMGWTPVFPVRGGAHGQGLWVRLDVQMREHLVVQATAGRWTPGYDLLGQKNGWRGRTAAEQSGWTPVYPVRGGAHGHG